MIDWNNLVLAPMARVFGEPVDYTPAGGSPIRINGVFDAGFMAVDPLGDPGLVSVSPRLGVQVSQLPAGWDARNAEGDTFTVVATGKAYRVRVGMPDSHGWARLDANAA